jgi:hypothetical protein
LCNKRDGNYVGLGPESCVTKNFLPDPDLELSRI